jgi:hypothetical protein
MLPQSIDSELFDIRHQVGEMALDYICTKIEQFGFVIDEQENLDLIVRIVFKSGEDYGELRIDRLAREFEICAVIDGETIIPAVGSWELVMNYLLVAARSAADSQI